MNELIDKFSNRLKKALNIRDIKPIDLSRKTGISKTNISCYMSGKYEAKQDGLKLIADALDVNPIWLMGYNVPMEKETFNLKTILIKEIFSINDISKIMLKNAIFDYSNDMHFNYDDTSNISIITKKIYEVSWNYESYLVANKFDCDINDLILKTDEDKENYKIIQEKVKQDMLQELNYILENYKKFIKVNEKVDKIPVLGIVKAGYDYLADENIIDYVSVTDSNLNNQDFFALKVKGNSMVPEIYENDIAIVKKQADFENGDYVVALINGEEATIKTGYKTDTGLLLRPANNAVPPLVFDKNDIEKLPVKIIGVVYNITRSFK